MNELIYRGILIVLFILPIITGIIEGNKQAKIQFGAKDKDIAGAANSSAEAHLENLKKEVKWLEKHLK